MPIDQPENPRIRTKINILDRRIDKDIFQLTEHLRSRAISVDQFQDQVVEYLQNLGMAREFANDIAIAKKSDDQHWLLRRHIEQCRYTVLFMKVDAGEVHPPHQHHNLISSQIVIEGQIHLREYERLRINENGQLVVRIVRDEILGAGTVFQASEWRRNVHWFSAIEGPAVVFNFNVRGYEKTTFNAQEEGAFGRRYVDPTFFGEDGLITCSQFDEMEAERRFQGKKLTNFPVGVFENIPQDNLGCEKTIPLWNLE